MKLIGNLREGIKDLFFPPFCLSCKAPLKVDEKLLCLSCLSSVEFNDPESRCPHCFLFTEDLQKHERACFLASSSLKKLMTVFEKEAPILQLAYSFTKERLYLARGIASFMAVFWLKENPLKLDLVTSLPVPWLKKERGFDPHEVIAREFAKIVGIPFLKPFSFSLQWIEKGQQRELFFVPKLYESKMLQDKNVLLIALSRDKEEEITYAAEALQEGCPQSLYALTFI